jgi:hypothetical protein
MKNQKSKNQKIKIQNSKFKIQNSKKSKWSAKLRKTGKCFDLILF